jgi:ribosomal protein S18 acetylase RimI-like enzyme
VYDEPEPPVLIALPAEPRTEMAALLESLLRELPPRLYVHTGLDMLPVLGLRYEAGAAEPHLKMSLADPGRLEDEVEGVVVLPVAARAEVEAFYGGAYPGTWFAPRMLETNRYVGVRDERGLACVAGVHVWSPRWRVAALGNVATRPDVRGRGLARRTCSALCRRLLADGIDTIALNVRADNAPAIRAYRRLGFETAAEYVEVMLQERG